MPESTKEGARGLPEGSDIGLGPGCREFESRHSDQNRQFSVRKLAVFLLYYFYVDYGKMIFNIIRNLNFLTLSPIIILRKTFVPSKYPCRIV